MQILPRHKITEHISSDPVVIKAIEQLFAVHSGDHSLLFNLDWSASGHKGSASTVLAFNSTGNAISKPVTGSGSVVLATSPSLVTPNIGTPSAGTLTNCSGLKSTSVLRQTIVTPSMVLGNSNNGNHYCINNGTTPLNLMIPTGVEEGWTTYLTRTGNADITISAISPGTIQGGVGSFRIKRYGTVRLICLVNSGATPQCYIDGDYIIVRQYSTPVSGETVAIISTGQENIVVLTPADDLASLTIQFPASSDVGDGHVIRIFCIKDVASVTFDANGCDISGCPSILTAFQSLSFIFDSFMNTWFFI